MRITLFLLLTYILFVSAMNCQVTKNNRYRIRWLGQRKKTYPLSDYECQDLVLPKCNFYIQAKLFSNNTDEQVAKFVQLYSENFYNKENFPNTYRANKPIQIPSIERLDSFGKNICKYFFDVDSRLGIKKEKQPITVTEYFFGSIFFSLWIIMITVFIKIQREKI